MTKLVIVGMLALTTFSAFGGIEWKACKMPTEEVLKERLRGLEDLTQKTHLIEKLKDKQLDPLEAYKIARLALYEYHTCSQEGVQCSTDKMLKECASFRNMELILLIELFKDCPDAYNQLTLMDIKIPDTLEYRLKRGIVSVRMEQ